MNKSVGFSKRSYPVKYEVLSSETEVPSCETLHCFTGQVCACVRVAGQEKRGEEKHETHSKKQQKLII